VALNAWNLAGGAGAFLAGSVSTEAPCPAARWARDAAQPAPTIFTRVPPAASRREALQRFRALPAYEAVTRDFQACGEAPPDTAWEVFDGARPKIRRWDNEALGSAYISVAAQASIGCDPFPASLWSFFEETGGTGPPLSSPTNPGYYTPLAVVDADGDGTPEVIAPDVVLRPHDGEMVTVLSVLPPNFDCDL